MRCPVTVVTRPPRVGPIILNFIPAKSAGSTCRANALQSAPTAIDNAPQRRNTRFMYVISNCQNTRLHSSGQRSTTTLVRV